ncbi:unnamed protein product [Symbiodinium natans]|uniref:PAS domain-containing protein n=1 Tax=Symbiodinium natans TaxID=878477 RepID=A0A812RMX9_9DINO|nr:unnamed protein product [Symbiodinium natans]
MKDVDSYVICDSKAKGFPIRHVSKGFEELFGYDASECVGMRCGEMIGGAGLLNHKPGMAMLNKVAADLGLTEEQANTGIRRMNKAAEEAVQTVNQGGFSQSVLLINTRKNGELFVCEMSLCKNQHPTMGWHYHAGIQRDVSDRISVERLLQAASEGVPYDQICQEWRTTTAPSIGETTLADMLGASQQDLHSVAEQMWKDELAKVFQKKDGSKTVAPDTDMRSVWSRSTASTMQSRRSSRCEGDKGEDKKIHHLGALFGAVIPSDSDEKAEKSEESGRFLDLLEGEFSDDEPTVAAPTQPPPAVVQGHALPLSIDALRQRELERTESVKSWQSEDFKSVSDTSEQEKDCDALSTEDNSPMSDTSLLCDEVQDPAKHVARSVLRNLEIPLVIAAPTVSGFPVVLRSQGFEDLLAGPSHQIKMGSHARHALQPSDERVQSTWADFCDSVLQGHIYVHPSTGGGVAMLEGASDITLPAGELAFVQPFHGRFGNVTECLVYLKQVELDDCPYLIAVHSYLTRVDDLEKDRPRALDSEFYKVGMRMDEVIAELAAEFFYYAPMRRQTTLYPRRERSCQDHALLDLLVPEF